MLRRFLEIISINDSKFSIDQEKKQIKLKQLKAKKSIQIGQNLIKIDRKIAEGGYADVYRVIHDNQNQNDQTTNTNPLFSMKKFGRHTISIYDEPLDVYALKRMYFQSNSPPKILRTDQIQSTGQQIVVQSFNKQFEINDSIKHAFESEVNILRMIGDHDNIVKLIDFQCTLKKDSCYEVSLLLEYCPHGTLFDVIEEKCKMGLFGISNETELLQIIYDVSNGLRFLHKLKIAHRDLKIENVMKGNDGKWKICDFGSCTQKQHNDALSQQDREQISEEIEKVTTPNYRAPEQLDLFKGYKINQKVDIWALGCVMYTLMYHKPPFLEGEKLAQINGNFRIPKYPVYSEFCLRLLRAMLTTDPQQRASAEQVFQAAQNLTEICLPKVNESEKDAFSFPEQKQNKNVTFDHFNQDSQQVQNEHNKTKSQFSKQENQISKQSSSQHKSNDLISDNNNQNTALVDELLESISENKTQSNPSPVNVYSKQQSHQSNGLIQNSINGLNDKKLQVFQSKFVQVLEMICNNHINKNSEDQKQPMKEKQIRASIDGIIKDEIINNRSLSMCIVKGLIQPKYVQENAISALKYLVYASKVIVYCPQIFEYCIDGQQIIELQKENKPYQISEQLKIFRDIHNHWLQILKNDNQVSDPTKTQQSSIINDPFIIRTAVALSGYLFNKVLMFQKFGNIIDIGLNIRGIVDGAQFDISPHNNKNTINKGLVAKKQIQSPLKVMFLKNLMNLWQHISVLNDKLFQDKTSMRYLKLQIGLSILEEQWLLLVNISHLFTAFQLQYNMSKPSLSQNLKDSFQQFIQDYQQDFHQRVESFIDLIQVLKTMPEIQHLNNKIPNIPINLVIIINELVERNLNKSNKLEGSLINLHQLLGINNAIAGMKIPIRFKSYIGFSQKCHDNYDVLLCWRSFRDKLGQKYQADLLRQELPVIGSIGNPQASSYGKFNKIVNLDDKHQEQLQQQAPFIQSSLQQRYQSISVNQFHSTHNLVQKVIDMQNQNNTSQFARPSVYSSEITIKLENGHASTTTQNKNNLQNANQITQNQQLGSDELRRAMYKSIDVESIQSIDPKITQQFCNDQKVSNVLQLQQTNSLTRSEVQFLNGIDKEGIQHFQINRDSIIANQNLQVDRRDQANNIKLANNTQQKDFSNDLTLDPSLFDLFTNKQQPVTGQDQSLSNQNDQQQSIQKSSQSKILKVENRASESEEFFNWARHDESFSENLDRLNESQNLSNQENPFSNDNSMDQSLNDTAQWQKVQMSDVDEKIRSADCVKIEETDQTKINSRVFDSQQSEFHLIKNQQREQVVKKRRLQRQTEQIDEDLQLEEQEFLENQQSRVEKEQQAFQIMMQEQLQKQEAIKTETTKFKQQHNMHLQELQNLQSQIQKSQQLQEQYQKEHADKIIQIQRQQQSLEEEKLKFQEDKQKQQTKLDDDEQRLKQIREKVKQNNQQIEQQKIENQQEKQKIDLEKQRLQQQQQDIEKQIEELQQKQRDLIQKDQEIQNQIKLRQSQEVQSKPTLLEPDVFEPDINNKEKNLAIQFIEFILRNKPSQKINVLDLENMTKIGEGAAANVFKAKYKFTDVAVKQLKVQSLIKENQLSKEFQREVEALVHMSHPNLVMFMGATANQGHPVIVTEYCSGGTLFELLHENKKQVPVISYKQRHQMALDIALGMHFMHTLQTPLMHRDLKSLNILLYKQIKNQMDTPQCKITDFGLARNAASENELMTGMAGTFHWMAPEILENQPYTFKADVYSFGIVMWEILAREPPFADYPPHKIIYNVINYKERPPLHKINSECPEQLKFIMKACWAQNPGDRPSFKEVIEALLSLNIQN